MTEVRNPPGADDGAASWPEPLEAPRLVEDAPLERSTQRTRGGWPGALKLAVILGGAVLMWLVVFGLVRLLA